MKATKARKIISAVAAAAVLALTMTACGGTSTEGNAGTGSQENLVNSVDVNSHAVISESMAEISGVENPENYQYKVYTSDDGETCVEITKYKGTDKEIVIPNYIEGYPVKKIGEKAFQNSDIESVKIPENIIEVSRYAFWYCKYLENLVISDGVELIGMQAFCHCEKLNNVTIPESIETIGYQSFSDCINLKNLTLNSCPKLICFSDTAFVNSGTTVTFNGKIYDTTDKAAMINLCDDAVCGDKPYRIDNEILMRCRHDVTEVNVPEGVTQISGNAFSSSEKLTKVTLPNTIKIINDQAFSNCINLYEINFPDGLICISSKAFDGCESLTEITLSDSLTKIYEAAFANCTKLKRANNLSVISYRMFELCTSLEKVDMNDNVTEIGQRAFTGCTNLKDIVIPDSVTKIEADAFNSCKSITDISLPDKIKLSQNVFYGCENINVKYKGETYSYSKIDSLYYSVKVGI